MKRLVFFALVLFACSQEKQPAVSFESLDEKAKRLPQNAAAGMEVADGLEMTLFASEPMLINPTNIHVDERGRVWVCEALNYRNTHNPENPYRKEGDRILILEDTDADGKADVSKVFYQGEDVNSALGIWTLGNRVIVSCSPNVFVFTDDNGDDLPDRKDTLFTGIGGLQTDHGMHSFTVGPDGKYYFNFGNTGEQLMDKHGRPVLDQTGQPVSVKNGPYKQGMVFRCDPDGAHVEVLAHNFRNNYEVAVDSYGALWQSDNDDDGNKGVRINYVMDYGNYGYVDEMTGAGWQERRVNMEADIPQRHWHQNDPGVVPNLLFTGSGSPCGITVYEGALLPDPFRNAMIHCEAGHNVVRAYPVQPAGAGYTASVVNLVEGKDEWFRPSDICTAPDGSVFIADWYDPAVGGHKFGDPERGRIYRVAPKGHRYAVATDKIDDVASAVKWLQNASLSRRAQAREYLLAQGEKAVPALEQAAKNADPRLRARALWILSDIPGQTDKAIQSALQDNEPELRAAALRMARKGDAAQCLSWVEKVVTDASAAVRREAALCLRYAGGPRAAQLWAQLARSYDGRDRWYLEALGIGSDRHPDSCFAAWQALDPAAAQTPAGRDIVWRVRAQAAQPLLAAAIADPQVSAQDAKRFFRAFDFHTGKEKNALLATLLQLEHPLRDSLNTWALLQIDPAWASGAPQVRNALGKVLPAIRGSYDYLSIVRRLKPAGQQAALLDMCTGKGERRLRAEAAGLLIDNGGLPLLLRRLAAADETGKIDLMEISGSVQRPELYGFYEKILRDGAASPALKRAAMNAFCNSWDGQVQLMHLLDQGKIPVAQQTPILVMLSGVWNTDVRQRARALLAARQQGSGALPPVAVLEGKSGSIAKGQAVFQQYCSICHQVNGQGVNFGPALSEIGSKLAKDALYNSIIYPSSGINFGYEGYTVKLKDGTQAVGIVESRTDKTLQLRLNGGIQKTYPMGEVAAIEELSESLMPEGLYKSMSEQELVDLVEYLASLKTMAGQ